GAALSSDKQQVSRLLLPMPDVRRREPQLNFTLELPGSPGRSADHLFFRSVPRCSHVGAAICAVRNGGGAWTHAACPVHALAQTTALASGIEISRANNAREAKTRYFMSYPFLPPRYRQLRLM